MSDDAFVSRWRCNNVDATAADRDVPRLHELARGTAEFNEVVSRFAAQAKMGGRVVSVQRVECRLKWAMYRELRCQLHARDGGDAPTEELLFHGASREIIARIVFGHGFDVSLAGAASSMRPWGVGAYFAHEATYSADPLYAIPYTDSDATRLQQIVLAKVTTGIAERGSEGATGNERVDSFYGQSSPFHAQARP